MKTLQQQLSNYARYHRSKRNVMTHFIGIPMIVFAIICLLARLQLFSIPSVGFSVTAVHIAAAVTTLYYLMLSLSLGVIMGVIFATMMYLAMPIAAMPMTTWLLISVGCFVVGWLFQFIGHYFEGKKPAFVDDIIGLIIGPLFVLVEVLFLLGLYQKLETEITALAGPTKP